MHKWKSLLIPMLLFIFSISSCEPVQSESVPVVDTSSMTETQVSTALDRGMTTTVTPTQGEKRNIILILNSNIRLLNKKLGNENEGLNPTSASFLNVYNALGVPLHNFPCENTTVDESSNWIDHFNGLMESFPFNINENTCFEIYIEKNNFNVENGSRGTFLAILGLIPINNPDLCNSSDYCGFWQPILIEMELPEKLWDDADNSEEMSLFNEIFFSTTSPIVEINSTEYFAAIHYIYPLSEEQEGSLFPLVNESNEINLDAYYE